MDGRDPLQPQGEIGLALQVEFAASRPFGDDAGAQLRQALGRFQRVPYRRVGLRC
jgi:hypothetical protein